MTNRKHSGIFSLMSPTPIALLTCREYPRLADDDRLILPWLQQAGVEAEPAIWNDPHVDWRRFRGIVIRTAWDYWEHPTEFLGWIESRSQEGIPLLNPAAALKWNLEKTYLRELEARGIPIVPTLWCEFSSQRHLVERMETSNWAKVVVKPTISAGARRTVSITRGEWKENAFADFPVGLPLMVQPFVREIQTEGEWSLLFFDGKFSHAVLKTPSPGDFRVQCQFGGSYRSLVPPPEALRLATQVIQTLPFSLTYARVDLVRHQDNFVLIELEILEPALYLSYCESAPQAFSQSIVSRLRS